MDELTITAAVLLGILLRFGIPILITIGLASLLRKLDERWRAEAEQEAAEAKYKTQQAALLEMWLKQPCWEIKNCSPTERTRCEAFQQRNVPCWEVFRSNGSVNTRCKECEYHKTFIETININQ